MKKFWLCKHCFSKVKKAKISMKIIRRRVSTHCCFCVRKSAVLIEADPQQLDSLLQIKTMIESVKDSIAYRNTVVLKPQDSDANLSNFLVVAIDSEYKLPIYNPFSSERLKEEYGLDRLPPRFTESRSPFRTWQMACLGKVTHWKPDRAISSVELCSWILSNLATWKIDPTSFKAIAVCSHWLLAEVQHLTDVKERFKAWGSTLYGEIDFSFDSDEWSNFNPFSPDLEIEHNKVKFKFIDTYTLFGMKLERLSEKSPFPKLRDDDEWKGKPFKYWRANPDKHFAEDEAHFWQYAESDCLGLEYCVLYWRKWIFDRWSLDILRTKTFSSIGLRILKSRIDEPVEPYLDLKVLDKKTKKPKQITIYDRTKIQIRDFFLDAYWGGRREVGERGLVPGPIYAYDISKLYTTAAIMQPLPNADTEFLMDDLDDSSNLDLFEGVIDARFEFPESVDYPCLPVNDERFGKLIFPRTGVTACGVAEIRLAKRLGAKIWIIRSCVFKPIEDEIKHPLRLVLEEILALANEFKQNGDKAGETFMKNIANGVIGKFIQKNKLEQSEEREQWKEQTLQASWSSWCPSWAALILSRARAIYGGIVSLGSPVYGHTDSVFSKSEIDLNAPIIQELNAVGSGLKLEAEFATFWTPRNACYYGRTADGKVVKIARGGLSGEDEVFKEEIESKLGKSDASNETVFVALKMASFKDKKSPLGSEVVTIRKTDFAYDDKRKLLSPSAKLWTESSRTRAWHSIDELLNEVRMKDDPRHRTLAEGHGQQTGRVGRPKVVTEEDLQEMRKRLILGDTRYKIAQKFKEKYSKQTVYAALKQSSLETVVSE